VKPAEATLVGSHSKHSRQDLADYDKRKPQCYARLAVNLIKCVRLCCNLILQQRKAQFAGIVFFGLMEGTDGTSSLQRHS